MELRLERKGEIISTDYLKIHVGETGYQIDVSKGELYVKKVSLNGDERIKVMPFASNSIIIE